MNSSRESSEMLAAILQMAQEKYGSFEAPNFSFVHSALQERPYHKLLGEFAQSFEIEEDLTDPNDDVSFIYVVAHAGRQWVLQLSMVGPYALCMRLNDAGRVDRVIDSQSTDLKEEEEDLLALLKRYGLTPLGRELLETPVSLTLFNTDPDCTVLYHLLFSDSHYLPWQEVDLDDF